MGFDKSAAVPMSLPVEVAMGPHIDDDPDGPDICGFQTRCPKFAGRVSGEI